MRTVSKALGSAALVLALLVGSAQQAQAVPVISVTPNGGDPNAVDIVLTNLEEIVGGVALLLNFNDATLTGTGYTINAAAFEDTAGSLLDFSPGFAGGGGSPFDLNFNSTEAAGALADNQGNPAVGSPVSLLLATITFDGPVANQSFSLANVDLSNDLGLALIPVCENGPCPTAPEPATLALLTTGLAALVIRRRRTRSNA